MGKKKDSGNLIMIAAIVLVGYLVLTGKLAIPGIGGGGQPISSSGGGAPGVGICGKQQIGIGSDGIPLTKDLPCQSVQTFALVGPTGEFWTFAYLTSTVTAATDTNFVNMRLASASISNTDAAIVGFSGGAMSGAFDNDGVSSGVGGDPLAAYRNSGNVPAGGSKVFSTLDFGPVGSSCGTWLTSCDGIDVTAIRENRTFSTTNNRCECVLSVDKMISIPGGSTRFTTIVEGAYNLGGTEIRQNVTGTVDVSIKRNPSGGFSVQTSVIAA